MYSTVAIINKTGIRFVNNMFTAYFGTHGIKYMIRTKSVLIYYVINILQTTEEPPTKITYDLSWNTIRN
jgi:hypothetical protein